MNRRSAIVASVLGVFGGLFSRKAAASTATVAIVQTKFHKGDLLEGLNQPTRGTFTIGINGRTTDAIPYDASQATIDESCRHLFG